jgi:dihydroorotate dehydrogenase
VIGANLGTNRGAPDPVQDYVTGLRGVYPLIDYVTINVSSPNSPGLRELQHGGRLEALLDALIAARRALGASTPSQPAPPAGHPQRTIELGGREGERAGSEQTESAPTGASLKPVLLKIAPDLEQGQERAIAETAMAAGIDGLIVSNTTLARPELRGRHRQQAGGLSGPPLMAISTAQLARLYRFTGGKLPLVGVGGIACGADAYAKIRAGASAVQLYTAFIYQGPAVVRRVLSELDALLARDGHASMAAAVGSDARALARSPTPP